VNDRHPEQLPASSGVIIDKNIHQLVSTEHPKVVFQVNQSADAPTILRFVTNYLIAEPTAKVAVVGYAGGAEFMLKGAKDATGKPYADQVQALANKGVMFRVCNNTLKARNLTAEDVIFSAVVVPGAVNEIIRLQTREGYAYFRH
jgi:intracellular sulfur oxidation DsrE/DsrF family protein